MRLHYFLTLEKTFSTMDHFYQLDVIWSPNDGLNGGAILTIFVMQAFNLANHHIYMMIYI
jgi:hypothetical protein